MLQAFFWIIDCPMVRAIWIHLPELPPLIGPGAF